MKSFTRNVKKASRKTSPPTDVSGDVPCHHPQEHGESEKTETADHQDGRVRQRIADWIVLTPERRHRTDQQRRHDREYPNLCRSDGRVRERDAPAGHWQRQEVLAAARLLEPGPRQADRKHRPDQDHRRTEPPHPDVAAEFAVAQPGHLCGRDPERAVRERVEQ